MMLSKIGSILDGSGRMALESQCDLKIALLGKINCSLSFEQRVEKLTISAKYISGMYDAKLKSGIG